MPYIRDDTGREKRCAQLPAVTTRRELTTRSSSKDDAKRSLTCNFCNTHEFLLPTITVTLVLKTGVKFTESVVVQTDKTGKMYFTSEVMLNSFWRWFSHERNSPSYWSCTLGCYGCTEAHISIKTPVPHCK